MNIGNINTTNYLVPAEGNTNAVQITGTASSTPYVIDWQGYAINNAPFIPQGVFIDNTQGTADLALTIGPLGYTIMLPAGTSGQYQFPAPKFQTASIVGAGQVNLIFVNFPVLPNGADVSIQGVPNFNLYSIESGIILPTQPAVNNAGLPYQVQQTPGSAIVLQSTITAATTATLTPGTANLNLRKLIIGLTENAIQAAAGVINLTATLNGTQVFKEGFYIPTTVAGQAGAAYHRDIPFDGIAFNAGTGSLVITLSSALTGGQIDINAYFG